jgi:hypothetical protein
MSGHGGHADEFNDERRERTSQSLLGPSSFGHGHFGVKGSSSVIAIGMGFPSQVADLKCKL